MAWWEPLALVGIAFGLSMVLVAIAWHWAPWWMARKACRHIDTEWDRHDEWFGSDGLWTP